MNAVYCPTRRRFLRDAAIGGVALLGWPRQYSWALEPSVTGAGELTVAYYTDVHARVEWGTPGAMMMAAAAINAQRPDVVLGGGDCITDGYTSSSATVAPRWEAYLAMHRAIQPAPEVAIGNHDLVGIAPDDGSAPVADPRVDFREKLGIERTYRSFDRNGYHFILLDPFQITQDELRYRGEIDAAQLDWLRADLAALDPFTPVVVVCHMPLLTSYYQVTAGLGEPVPPNRGVVNSRDVLALFEGRRVLAVLQGHLHVDEMIRWRGTTFITGGAVCGKWWRGAWQGTPEGFGILKLRPHRVDWTYQTYGWTARRPAGV